MEELNCYNRIFVGDKFKYLLLIKNKELIVLINILLGSCYRMFYFKSLRFCFWSIFGNFVIVLDLSGVLN